MRHTSLICLPMLLLSAAALVDDAAAAGADKPHVTKADAAPERHAKLTNNAQDAKNAQDAEDAKGAKDSNDSKDSKDAKPQGDVQMSGMSVLGNDEAPKSLVIVPWKSSQLGDMPGLGRLLDDSTQPVDKEVFLRELSYYQIKTDSK